MPPKKKMCVREQEQKKRDREAARYKQNKEDEAAAKRQANEDAAQQRRELLNLRSSGGSVAPPPSAPPKQAPPPLPPARSPVQCNPRGSPLADSPPLRVEETCRSSAKCLRLQSSGSQKGHQWLSPNSSNPPRGCPAPSSSCSWLQGSTFRRATSLPLPHLPAPRALGLTTPRARQETDAEDMFDYACDQLKETYEWGIRSRKALHQYQGFEDASACYASTWGKFQLADPAKFSRVTTRSPPPVGFPGDFFRLAG